MKVINFFAGPGAGKSTTAAGLFYLMKARNERVELVTEFAKDVTYEDNVSTLSNQLALLGEQDRRLRRLEGQVDFAITDSPLLLGLVYASGIWAEPWFQIAVRGAFSTYRNINFFVRAVKPYQTYGRRRSEQSAREVDHLVKMVLAMDPYTEVDGDEAAPRKIYDLVMQGPVIAPPRI